MTSMLRTASWVGLSALVMFLSACGGGGGGASCSSTALGSLVGSSCSPSTSAESPNATTANQPPVARAGLSRSAVLNALVTLSGSDSSDPDRDTLTYEWTSVSIPTGSRAALDSPNTARPSFTPDVEGAYIFGLKVSDGKASSLLATVTITAAAANVAPTAVASAPNQAVINTAVTLDATASSDPNRDALRFTWAVVSKPAGSAATVSDAAAARPTFVPDVAGAYVFSLRATDGRLDSDLTFITVNAGAANVAPVASAGSDQSVSTGDIVSLDGTLSTDANRDTLTYSWRFVSRPPTSVATLSTTSSARPRFVADLSGVYVLSLIVSDGRLESRPEYVTITASAANGAPEARAGANQQVRPGAQVTLDGTGSSDPNRDTLSYAWTLVSRPPTSTALLSNRAVARPTFVADVPGLYVASLQVGDGRLQSAASVVVVTAEANNAAPRAVVGEAQNVKVNATVILNGTQSTDPELDPLSFQWGLISAPEGATPRILGDKSPIASFTPTVSGVYVVSLVVSDGTRSSPPAYLTVNAAVDNQPPTAVPGTYDPVSPNTTVVLNGSASTDPERDTLKYLWTLVSRPSGSTADIQSPTAARPVLVPDISGTYVVSLVVDDGRNKSQPVNTVITADTGPLPPTASIAAVAPVKLGLPVQLDGSGSRDPNGDPLTYVWTITYQPEGSGATLDTTIDGTLSTRNSPRPAFVPDKVGVYVIALVVTDSARLQSAPAVVTVTVVP